METVKSNREVLWLPDNLIFESKVRATEPATLLPALLQEATTDVETQLSLEDKGWLRLGTDSSGVIAEDKRRDYVIRSRRYAELDPLATQSIRLWTDYTFGTGMTWQAEDEKTAEVLTAYWDSVKNKNLLSPKGQRKSSDKYLIDGEIFFALFLGTSEEPATIRRIDPLEITEILSDPDDIEDVRYYKREWYTPQGQMKTGYYRSLQNEADKACPDYLNDNKTSTEQALVYHQARGTQQRGLPLLLPALDWIYEYRRFLSSRVAVMLALARFVWKTKIQGGAAAVAAIKGVLQDKYPQAASTIIENMGSDTQPINANTNASGAYQDGRMLKLQVAAAVGIPEQYFGDISIGNLATAKTVELPMQKMFQSYQSIWGGAYKDLDEIVLKHADVPEDTWYVDRDFPSISPEDAGAVATNAAALLPLLPQLADSRDVMQTILMAMGVKDTEAALEAMEKVAQESGGDKNINLIKALRDFKEAVKGNGHLR